MLILIQIINNIMRSFTNLSINSIDDPIYENNSTFFKDMTKKLQQASRSLSFSQFNTLFKLVVRKCIKKAEVDSTFTQALPNLKKWIQTYSYDLETMARILILQSITISKQMPSEALNKLNKVKHLLVDTDYEYLIPKVFVMQSRIYQITNDRQQKLKILRKCIQFGENYALQYLKQSNQIRLQIADNMIIAYFQVYKLIKETKPNVAIDYLSKAYQAAFKNYGHDHFSTVTLSQIINQQRNLLTNMQRLMPKALSQIQTILIKKSTQLSILYSWEEQLLVVQLYKIRADQQKFIAQSTVDIKLDMEKMKLLKTRNYQEWLQISNSQIKIIQQQLKKIVLNEAPKTEKPSFQTLKQYGKNDLFKNPNQQLASSSSDDDLLQIPDPPEKFLKFLTKEKSRMSRSKSRENTSRH